MSKISWIDCIQLNDHRYSNNNWPPKEIDKSLIDEEIVRLKEVLNELMI